ncbi:MAG: hypothetical protein ACO3UW_11940 [Candidatus Nanopelagicales bacterium]
MGKGLKISVTAAWLLSAAAGMIGGVSITPDAPAVGALLDAVANAAQGLADAGATDSPDGRYVDDVEAAEILSTLVQDLDYAAAQVPAEAVSVPVPGWAAPALGALALLLSAGDGLLDVIAAALRSLADACRDGVIDAQEIRATIAAIRAAAVDAA